MAIPITARALGPVRFGLLGLSWALLEYLSFVDLGLGRASVRFVAQSLARSTREVRQTIAVAVASQSVLGVIASILVFAAAIPLASAVFTVPVGAQQEAAAMFRAVGANVAVVIAIGALRGVLEGAQRFDLSTAVKVPTAVAAVVIPAIGASAGSSLSEIMWWVFAARVATVMALVLLIPRALSGFAWETPREWLRLRPLLSYSGWLSISGVLNPILASFDRFVLGAFAGVAAVGFYAAPYEGATRLLLIPTSLFAALFPALSAAAARGEDRHSELLELSVRQLALVLAAPIVLLFVFAPEILRVWLGPIFAAQGSSALRILLIGVAANGLAHVPAVFLYAIGRPDIPAKNHMVELLIYVPLTLWLVRVLGIPGAAVAWTVRVTIDAALLFFFAGRAGAWSRTTPARWIGVATAIALLMATTAAGRWVMNVSAAVAVAVLLAGVAGFIAISWLSALSAEERRDLLRVFAVRYGMAQRIS